VGFTSLFLSKILIGVHLYAGNSFVILLFSGLRQRLNKLAGTLTSGGLNNNFFCLFCKLTFTKKGEKEFQFTMMSHGKTTCLWLQKKLNLQLKSIYVRKA
jgi:hypothetical protein